MKSRPLRPATNASPSRRQALKQIGVSLGASVVPASGLLSSCGFPPTLADQCAADPGLARAAESSAPRGVEASRLLGSIDTIVVVMMENRSFDHLFGSLRGDRDYPARARVDGLTGAEWNPDVDGRPVMVSRLAGRGDGSVNPVHTWLGCRDAWNGGLNDRFVVVNQGPFQNEIMSYLTRDQVPFQYALADNFTVCDRWFASFMGQTWPNRYYLHATTSGGRRENLPLGLDAPPTIWERTALTCHSVKHYAAGPILWYTVAFPAKIASGNSPFVPSRIEDFFADARNGTLPNFAVIDPDFKVSDGYPTHDIRVSEAFLSSVYRAMANGPQWGRSLLVVTYDEHGGYFDHVAPPRTVDPRADFQQLGFRVPAMIIGPTVRTGQVVSTTFEHSSVAATLAARYGIESLGPRMDAAADLSACIDPDKVGRPAAPAPVLPAVELEMTRVAQTLASPTSQGEMDRALDTGGVPAAAVDPRSTEERFASWLRLAQELEAVKLVG